MKLSLKHALVIDDDTDFCDALSPWLQKLGYQATVAHSVEEAADYVNPETLDVILLDLQLPGIHGHFLQRELNRQGISIPTIIMSGGGSVDDVVESFHQKAADYLQKPFSKERLASALERAGSAAERASPPETPAAQPSPPSGFASAPPVTQEGYPSAVATLPIENQTAEADIRPAVRHLVALAQQGKLQLPVFDPRASQLQAMLAESEPSMQQVADFIQRDVTLATEVLRAANSVYYARGTQIKKLRDACVRLGSKQVVAIAFQTVMRSQFDASQSPHGDVLQNMWRNAVITSRLASTMARTLKLLTAEEFQVIGLLHNTGEFIFVRMLGELSEKTGTTYSQDDLAQVCRERHEDFGLAVARRWKLPNLFQRLIGYHHRPSRQNEKGQEKRDRCIILASWKIAVSCGYGYFSDHGETDPGPEAAFLGLDDRQVQTLYQQTQTWSP